MKKQFQKTLAALFLGAICAAGAVAGPFATSSVAYKLTYSASARITGGATNINVTFNTNPVPLFAYGYVTYLDAFASEANVMHNGPSYGGGYKDARLSAPNTVFNANALIDSGLGSAFTSTRGDNFNSTTRPNMEGNLVAKAAVGQASSTQSDSNSQMNYTVTISPYTVVTFNVTAMQFAGFGKASNEANPISMSASTGVSIDTGTMGADGAYRLSDSPVFKGTTLSFDAANPTQTAVNNTAVTKTVSNNTGSPMTILLAVRGFASAAVKAN